MKGKNGIARKNATQGGALVKKCFPAFKSTPYSNATAEQAEHKRISAKIPKTRDRILAFFIGLSPFFVF